MVPLSACVRTSYEVLYLREESKRYRDDAPRNISKILLRWACKKFFTTIECKKYRLVESLINTRDCAWIDNDKNRPRNGNSFIFFD